MRTTRAPTASPTVTVVFTGRPGTHHIEARAFKDVFPRFKTMQGWHVPRRAGWDCHGLPVEIAVEQELGFAGKPDIERYGIAEFNARCRESVERHVDAFTELTQRMGGGRGSPADRYAAALAAAQKPRRRGPPRGHLGGGPQGPRPFRGGRAA